jgi:hypothetical protein
LCLLAGSLVGEEGEAGVVCDEVTETGVLDIIGGVGVGVGSAGVGDALEGGVEAGWELGFEEAGEGLVHGRIAVVIIGSIM